MKRNCFRTSILAALLLSAGACAGVRPAGPHFVLPRQPDDVRLQVSDLSYRPEISGYTFTYYSEKSGGIRWVYVRKDLLVGVRAEYVFGEGRNFQEVWLRHDWDGPLEPVTREELARIPSLPAKHPEGR
ncbi:MAG: hypothetical protein JWN24_2034 [Phycisphaerales bacterium]|nr:hypothetical protein [Phycisphaerales bacterium]